MRRSTPKVLLSITLMLSSFLTGASVVLPGDGPYYRWHRGETLYIFDQEARDVAPQLAAYHEVFRRMYDKSYGWKLDERQDLILTSYKQQVANAFATVVPNIKTVWYPSGAGFLEDSATSSWLLTLDAHETAHLYQLNAKGDVPSAFTSVLGNAPYAFLFVWPIFLHPNFFTPTFMVEGNAVLQESRINQGGRLHSGEMRALVLAQIQAGHIDPARLINDQFRFPFGQTAYLQGGYFQAHLAGKHGLDKTNQFFLAQGNRYIWPFILNKTFRDHFGASYPQEIREYVRGMEGLAAKQKSVPAPPLMAATLMGAMNHDAGRVWFMTSNGTERAVLRVLDKRNKFILSQPLDLAMGKVFFEGETPLAVDSKQHDLHHISYSLYGEGQKLIGKYRGQIVTDQRAGKTAAMDATHSWYESRLLMDGVPYDITHSSAILDDLGNVYYFRQNGAERVLYKNREPVFKMEGFYGKPTEVTADGTIYFIGATEYGSTLFRYKNKEISRVLASDRVVDARLLNDNEFVIDEIGANGHSVHIVAADVKPVVPAVYNYAFASENVIPDPAVPSEQAQKETRRYNGLTNLRYSLIEMSTVYSSTPGLGGSVNALFNDPLDYHQVGFGYAGTQFRDQAAQFSYAYTRYLADIVLRYRYKEEWWERSDGVDQMAYNQDVAVGMRLPLLRWRRWDAALGMALSYELEDAHNDPTHPPAAAVYPDDFEEAYGIKTNFIVQREEDTPLGMYRWRHLSLKFFNHLSTEPNQWVKKDNTSLANLNFEHGFPHEFYLSAYAYGAWAETRDIDVKYSYFASTSDAHIPMLTSHKQYLAKTAGSARLEFHKVFNLKGYSARVPVGLDRIAPVAVAQGISLDDARDDRYPPSIFEWGIGADLQVLMFHRVPTIMRFLNAINTTEPRKSKELRVEWTLKKTF